MLGRICNRLKVSSLRCSISSPYSLSQFYIPKAFTFTQNINRFHGYSFATSQQSFIKNRQEYNNFQVIQLNVRCLSLYCYMLISNKDCILIDIDNDLSHVLEHIKNQKLNLKGLFLTHYHADYIAGSHELDCPIFMGPKSLPGNKVVNLKDGEEFQLGSIKIKCIHTPGHTEESSCFVAMENGEEKAIFTGDTLFLNEVGRPDLAVKTNLTAHELALMLYDSLQKLKKLKQTTVIYPGHGSGSSCGKSIGKGDFCVLEKQLKNNYGLTASNKQQFAQKVLQNMPPPPSYFFHAATINKYQQFSFQKLSQKIFNRQLNPKRFTQIVEKNQYIVIDSRSFLIGKEASEERPMMIKKAISFGNEGSLANWVGTLFKPTEKFVIYGKDKSECFDTIRRLLRIGFKNIQGYAFFEYSKAPKIFYQPSYTSQFQKSLTPNTKILDVRKESEITEHGVASSENNINIQLSTLQNNLNKLDKTTPYLIHCMSGYRAKIAYTILKREGFENIQFYSKSFTSIVESLGQKKNKI